MGASLRKSFTPRDADRAAPSRTTRLVLSSLIQLPPAATDKRLENSRAENDRNLEYVVHKAKADEGSSANDASDSSALQEPTHLPPERRIHPYGPYVGVVSGKGIPDKLVHSTNYEACEDCGLKLKGGSDSCCCGVYSPRGSSIPSEVKDDPRLLSLYTEALESGKNKDYSIRVNVVGNYKQGKTTLVRRLVAKDVDDVESTNGINIDKYICEQHGNAVQQRLTTLKRRLRFTGVSSNTEKLAMESERPLAVHIWDFGGQFVFYATHTLFHSSRAVYVLVFDLSSELSAVIKDEEYPADTKDDKNMEYFARFWMNSIHSCVGSTDGKEPPVIIVGTHMDKLHGSFEEKRRQADTYFEHVRQLFDETQIRHHILPMDFAVDNTDPSDKETENLRDEIFRIGRSRAKLYDIPAKWIPLADALKDKKDKRIIPFDLVVEIDAMNEFPIKDENQIKLFLQYHHAKGTLIYFDEDTLSNHVVLDVQYLIDAFKCIITSERFCRKDNDIRPFWRKLISEGKLEINLIDAVWSRDVDHNFMTHKSVLLEYLKRHHIISEVLEYDENTGQSNEMGWYIVPCLLTCPINQDELKVFLTGKQQTVVRMVITFPSSCIIHNVFHRFLAAALGRWPLAYVGRKTLLYENLGVVLLCEDHVGIAEINGENIDLRVVNLCLSTSIDYRVADKFRRFADSFVENEFKNLNEENVKLNRQNVLTPVSERFHVISQESIKPSISSYRCNHASHGKDGSTKIELLEKWRNKELKVLPCPDHMTHEIDIRSASSQWFQQDTVTGIVSDTMLNEKNLSKISQAIGRNWEILGLDLGLTTVEIDHICSDNQRTVMSIFEMLRKWQSRNGDDATLRVLVDIMKKCQSVNIDWDKIRNIIDELE